MPKTSDPGSRTYDVLIVGAGFAGLYALHLLRQRGWSVKVVEAADDVGGTWYWNRYPGARCDAQSLIYSYSFDERLQREWRWSERYATQPEILRYLNFVADRLDLRRDIQFETQVESAAFAADDDIWTVRTAAGGEVRARYLIMATGALSVGRLPAIPGIESFRGRSYHTADWPRDGADVAGKRVAVIGTGSSGVQVIPLIAESAAQLTVFQRTPAYCAPARNAPLTDEENARYMGDREGYRRRMRRGEMVGIGDVILGEALPPTQPSTLAVADDERERIYEDRWQVGGGLIVRSFADSLTDETANQHMADFFRRKIQETVKDPETARKLTPVDYPVGSKRVCIGTDYYETYNRPNVRLVDVNETPIEAVTRDGIRTSAEEMAFDVIIYATGFDAMTGALSRIEIRGVDGNALSEEWAAGPQTYLGLAMAGFPNLFVMTGPGSPSVLGNVVASIEQHVEWTTDLLDYARAHGATRIEADVQAQSDWSAEVTGLAAATLMMKGKSWYRGANIPGKPQVFMPYVGGIGAYRDVCEEVAAKGYRSFHFTSIESERAELAQSLA